MTRHIQNRIKLRERQNGRCCYCDVEMVISNKPLKFQPANEETLEHLERRAEGGRNNRDNIALACRRCNAERGAMDWLTYKTWRRGEFYEFLGGLF
ncbi:HNH endonuclease [Rhizobium calliandrae]|uniref:HNH endonuclease n=1 Tax=Rhizobium calliandrae TaxID=1312182 RepID=A0ABT7KMU4_9HYPH|nr:HNH endonuclease [Rhizobium calliandrae]MDL2409950.1 HNH endonuclease [Rhizobium calliandrae]